MTRPYRPLTSEQIKCLTQQGCTCPDWTEVQISRGGNVNNITQTHFGEAVKLGRFEKQMTLPGGITRPTGIRHATLDHATVGDNCVIQNVGLLAHYQIDPDCILIDIGRLTVTEPSRFGNGVQVAAVNEAGGREVTLFEDLSLHCAFNFLTSVHIS